MAEATGLRNNALPYPIYGQPWGVVFPILDADGDLVTGATGLDSEISLNGDTFADCTNEATEIATSSGTYYLLLTAANMTADVVIVIVKTTSSGAKTTVLTFYPRKLVTLRTGTAAGGAAGSITLDSGASAEDDFYNGCVVAGVLDSTNEVRIITDYTGSTKVASVTPNWNTTPDSDDTFIVYLPEGRQLNQSNVTHWNNSSVASPDTAGYPKVTVKSGTGTGEVNLTSGRPGINWGDVTNPTTSLALTGTTIATTQKVDVETIKTQAVTCAAGVTVPATIASTTNITAGTITTVTNLTNAATSGDFTATMKTSIGTAVAASAVASVTGNVGGNVVGSVGSVVGAVGSVTGDVGGDVVGNVTGNVMGGVAGDVAGNVLGGVAGSVLGDVAGKVLGNGAGTITATGVWALDSAGAAIATAANLATVDTVVDSILVDTAEIGAAGAGLTALATQASVNTIDDFLDTEIAAIKAKTDQLTFTVANQVDSNALSGGGGLDAAGVRAAVGLASANLDTQLDALPTANEVRNAVWAKAMTELASVPGVTGSVLEALEWCFLLARNKVTQTSTTQTLRNDADSGSIGTAAVSDDGTTATRGEWA